MPRSLRAAGTGTSIAAISAGVAFLCNLLISLQLGPAQRGQVALVLQVSYLVAPIVMLGADRNLLRTDAVSDHVRGRQHLLPMTVLASLVLLVIFRDWTVLAGPIAYAACWLVLERSVAYREHRFRLFVLMMLGYQIFIAASSVALYLLDITDWLAWLAPYVVPAAVFIVVDLATSGSKRFTKPFKWISRTSLQLLPSALALAVTLRLDRVLLPSLAGDAQLGLYVTVATATETLSWLAASLADHRVAHLTDRSSRRTIRRVLLRDLALFGLLAVIVAAGTRYLVLPILGAQYESASALVIPLTIAALALALYRLCLSMLLGSDAPARASTVTCVTAVLAVPAYLLSIYLWGAMGAAWASFAVYLFGAVLGFVMMGRNSR